VIEYVTDFSVFVMLLVALVFAIYGAFLWLMLISAWVGDVMERPKSREEENKKHNDIT
jgi:putative effector of murein hydrolase LrgA (UPF0299 family)